MESRPYFHRHAEKAAGLPLCIFLFWLCLSAVFPAEAQAAPAAGEALGREKLPTVVTAKTLIADNRKRTVTYKTDVVVKRGEVTLYADEVVIRLSGKDNSGGKEGAEELFSGTGGVKTIEAVGGVKIVQGDKTATADAAVYDASEEKITLTGSPRVWQGANVLTGSSITFDVVEDTITVEDARTILYQDGEVVGETKGRAE